MWSEEHIESYLKEKLESKRFLHSLSVRDTAVKMARHYGVDEYKARIAGLVHDCAKNIKGYELINIVKKHGYKVNEIYEESPQLLHGLVGAIIARDIMGIKDKEIFNAIAYHTTGRKNMTLLEKIIYLADYIEPLRKYPGVDELRKLSYDNIDKAIVKSFDITIKYVIERGQMLHLDTIEARNYLIKIVGE
ncbi:putative HD superfamily hydrolase involved in NAD metabolism [Clostridium tetanomorphum]|uniref:bis(5'-nucleosyl)-tetraphosphatase (symmetrical) n=1 Tax=Clostridium tetanomorphum TaxID=1553 RepID=A0A923EAC8_CLOTT|nr:bis(5'-nucleosyl)-tetraphosphatase (symmetrical) YqeK [Clostridium tetanomorphum]KAJ53820.1 metal dependent phosphohydrolase [Clostridium tetanomorphum DSM 665]MBC2397334.1 HD domain-containing protein [Clostridium tetanomorphum]NRS85606.1 putative HD superfamily hydrolase involved in NAD metabolism [Clostridium tetanomorphum]NRZ96383.1 putative HD superfamily hydrolase involved in NAD metabolism [Clostridium tetanomorphum]SQC02667.1 metal dependent phosphohydrolase [Clostridium tetanomorph